ncbi:MAG: hypothetical protein Kow00122_00880 [Thermoleophilia bacterium]
MKHIGEESVKERILSVAGALFARLGYHGTSVRAIAEGVGVTVPALYYHFGSKRGIMLALVEEHCARKQAEVRAALERGGCCAERLGNALTAYVNLMAAEVGMATVVHRDPSLFADPELRQMVIATERVLADLLAAVVAEGADTGEFRRLDPHHVALVLLAAARVGHVSRGLGGRPVDHGALAGTLIDLVLEGLRPGAPEG